MISILCSHLEPTGGLERAVLELAELLSEEEPIEIVTAAGRVPDCLAGRNVAVRILGGELRGFSRILSVVRIARWMRRPDVDVIVAAGAWVAVPATIVKPVLSVRRLIVWEHSFSEANVRTNRGLRLLWHIAKCTYRRADYIVAVSDNLARQVSGLGSCRTRRVTIDNAVRPVVTARPRRADVDDGVRLLSVGSLTPTKNQQLALKALALLPDQFKLAFAGDGPDRARLEGLARSLGVDRRVQFLGHVRDINVAYSAADVVVHPSHGETFGYALLEAAAHHLPVVVLDKGIMQELVPSVVPGIRSAEDPESLAMAIRATVALLNDGQFASLVAGADELRSRKYCPSAVLTRWISVLHSSDSEAA